MEIAFCGRNWSKRKLRALSLCLSHKENIIIIIAVQLHSDLHCTFPGQRGNERDVNMGLETDSSIFFFGRASIWSTLETKTDKSNQKKQRNT